MIPLILITGATGYITGATGYVGGELLKALLSGGRRVRCLARRPETLRTAAAAGAEVVRGDVLDPASVRVALTAVDTAYYLIHSMGAARSFEEQDRAAARVFGDAGGKPECAGSCTSAGSAEAIGTCQPIFAAATKSGRSCGPSGCR